MESNSSSDIKDEETPPITSAMENLVADPSQAEAVANCDGSGDSDCLAEVALKMQNLAVASDSKATKPKETGQVEVELDDDKEDASAQKEPENTAKFHPFLLEYKGCFFNWILNANPLTYDEAGLLVSKEKAEASIHPSLVKHIQWRPLGTVSQQLHLAFCHLVQKNLIEAERELKIVAALIGFGAGNKYLSVDHVEGLTHVYCGLLALKQSILLLELENEEKNAEELKLKEYIANRTRSNEPECFSNAAKTAIKFVQSFFLGARRSRDQQLVVVKEIVTIQPTNVECWIYLYTCYRLDRKANDYKAGPNADEENALYRAWKIEGSHVLVKLSLAIYLSDMLRTRKANFQKGGWVVLHEVAVYHALDEVVEAIQELAEHVLEVAGMVGCVRTNVCMADIFSSGLPYNFREDLTAKRCLENAILMNPNCSSAGHKLGLLKLKLGSSVDEALVHVRQAFVVDQRNFPALIDTVQMLMSNPNDKEKREELMDLLLKNLDKDKWPENQLASLYITHGFFLFMIGEKEGAILALTIAHRIQGKAVKENLEKIPFLSKRYHWNSELLSQPSLRDYMLNEIIMKPTGSDGNDKGFDMETCKKLYQYLNEALLQSSESGSIFARRGAFRGNSRGPLQSSSGRGNNGPDLWRQGRDNNEVVQGSQNMEFGRGNTSRGGRGGGSSRGSSGPFSSNNRGRGGFLSSNNRGRGGFLPNNRGRGGPSS